MLYILLELDTDSEVTPTYLMAHTGEPIRFTCNYGGNVTWFFMITSEFPRYPPIECGNVLEFDATTNHSGFYFCSGYKLGKRYISRSFLEIVGMYMMAYGNRY